MKVKPPPLHTRNRIPIFRKECVPAGTPPLNVILQQEDEEEGEYFVGRCLPDRLAGEHTSRLWWALADLEHTYGKNAKYFPPLWVYVDRYEFHKWLVELGFTGYVSHDPWEGPSEK